MRTTMAVIRLADEADAGAMLAIYAPYVRETAISFELEPPSEGEFRRRVRSVLEAGPWLLCDAGGHASRPAPHSRAPRLVTGSRSRGSGLSAARSLPRRRGGVGLRP